MTPADTLDKMPDRAKLGTVLQVGGCPHLSRRLAELFGWVSRCQLRDIDEALKAHPFTVVTPWIDGATDCMDVAAALTAQDWDGVMLIDAPSLPHPGVLLQELADRAPFLTVRMLYD
jgi:hypothetical protein